MDAPMQDCETLTALKRAKAFLLGFVDDPQDADDISLGLCFINLDNQKIHNNQKQQPEDSEDDNIVESTNSMSASDFSVDSKADSAEVEAMPDSDCSVESDADDGSVTRKRKFESEEGESQEGKSP